MFQFVRPVNFLNKVIPTFMNENNYCVLKGISGFVFSTHHSRKFSFNFFLQKSIKIALYNRKEQKIICLKRLFRDLKFS